MDERDEIDEVLAALQGLIEKTEIPVVRACLEEAHDDIAHLAGKDLVPAGAEQTEVA